MTKADLFIDGAFLDHIIKQANSGKHPTRFDYEKFTDEVCKLFGWERNRTYYYHCYPYEFQNANDEQKEFVKNRKAFLDSLKRTPCFILRTGKVKSHKLACQKCNTLLTCNKCKNDIVLRQKGADTRLAVDAVILALKKETEAMILVGGDADFITTFEEARKNVHTGLAYYDYRTHGGVVKYSDELYSIFDERKELTPNFIKQFIITNK